MANTLERLNVALAARYRVEREIGAGGMAVVYQAEDLKHRCTVALKVLRPELTALVGTERFLHEIEYMRKLGHPFILPLHDSGTVDGMFYYVMPFIDGTLRDRLRHEKQLPVEDAVRITCELADALDHAHQKDIVHRDLKPENVLFQGGHALVADFGIAKAIRSVGGESLTASGIVLGTPAYMSPEQLLDSDELDGRSDLYSLGCVLYELLAGQPPFTGATAKSIVQQHLKAPIPDIGTVRPSVPPGIRTILSRALSKEPADRYSSGAQLKDALERVAASMPSGEPTPTEAATEPLRPSSGTRRIRPALAIAVVALAAVVGKMAWDGSANRSASPVTSQAIESVAVLPLVNLSGDPAQDAFTDGMHVELINIIAQISAPLRVVSQRSVMQYRDSQAKPSDIARELGVDALVEGAIMSDGDHVRINVMLIEGLADRTLWSDSYEREMKNVLYLQYEVSTAIATEIQGSLSEDQLGRVQQPRSVAPQAIRLYHEGRGLWNERTPDALRKALGHFEAVIAIDPDFGEAYAGIADAYGALGMQGGLPLERAHKEAKRAAIKALAINNSRADAHASLGNILQNYEWNWPEAEREYRRAIQLNPNYVSAHHWLALLLSQRGEASEALEEMRIAAELDPRSVPVNMGLGVCYYYDHQYDEAIEQYIRSRAIDESHPMLYRAMAGAYVQKGMTDEAITSLQGYFATLGDSATAFGIGQTYAAQGMEGVIDALIGGMIQRRESDAVHPVRIAELYAYLGDRDHAFEWLDVGYQERDIDLNRLKVDPLFDNLRDDPRFTELLSRPLFKSVWSSEQAQS